LKEEEEEENTIKDNTKCKEEREKCSRMKTGCIILLRYG
jgi:hypothetical protein